MVVSGVRSYRSKVFVGSIFKSLKKCYELYFYYFNANPMQKPTMVELVIVGKCHLRTVSGTYEQFISGLWNDFKDHKSLWNGAQVTPHQEISLRTDRKTRFTVFTGVNHGLQV